MHISTLIRAALLTSAALGGAEAAELSFSGTVSSGSSAGLISNGAKDYAYDGNTKNLSALLKACPLTMGEIITCKVRFREQNGTVTEILSAKGHSFGGKTVNKPGNVVDAFVCDRAEAVGYDQKVGCQHFDSLTIQVLATKGAVTKLRWNGQEKYTLTQRTLVNCNGTSISVASFLGRSFPPEIKSC